MEPIIKKSIFKSDQFADDFDITLQIINLDNFKMCNMEVANSDGSQWHLLIENDQLRELLSNTENICDVIDRIEYKDYSIERGIALDVFIESEDIKEMLTLSPIGTFCSVKKIK